jgi:hydroxymethylpyrimidine pyrophosphatase-like HAD family hydrolase
VPRTPARLLLALDCDGTLLDPAGQIRPRVRDAVREAAARGALVTLATGRRLGAARHYAEALGLRTPLVLHDGAAVQDPRTGALVYQDPLPPALVVPLVAAILDHGLHPVACRLTADPDGDTLHVLAASERDPLLAAYLAARSPVARGDRAALEQAAPVVRLSGMGPAGAARRFTAHVEGRLDALGCAIRLNAPLAYADLPLHMAQVTNGGCSKARALAALAAHHGLTLADCVAVGDGENDLELLREVGAAGGAGVAMGQAPPAVRAAAGHTVAGNDADGVAEAVARFVLPRLRTLVDALEPRPTCA